MTDSLALTSNQPNRTVAVLIPCYNEEKYIGRCLDSLLANDYPTELLDIVVLDGNSDDGTQAIVARYSAEHSHIRLLPNPDRLKPIALNLGITNTTGDVVLRIDAHATYNSDYISKLVAGLYEHDCDNIGGIRETHIGGNVLQRAICLSIGHSFAVGDAHWRTGSNELKEVDTVFCGCYKREVFERIGLFNEILVRTQDREFNFRLKNAGGRILLDPSVRCTYFPRTEFSRFVKWNFTGAKWLFWALKLSPINQLSLRNLIPPAFVLGNLGFLLSLLLLIFCTATGREMAQLYYKISTSVLALPLVAYWLLAGWHGIKTAIDQKMALLAPTMTLVFFLTHFSYGLGALVGLLKWLKPGQGNTA